MSLLGCNKAAAAVSLQQELVERCNTPTDIIIARTTPWPKTATKWRGWGDYGLRVEYSHAHWLDVVILIDGQSDDERLPDIYQSNLCKEIVFADRYMCIPYNSTHRNSWKGDNLDMLVAFLDVER